MRMFVDHGGRIHRGKGRRDRAGGLGGTVQRKMVAPGEVPRRGRGSGGPSGPEPLLSPGPQCRVWGQDG